MARDRTRRGPQDLSQRRSVGRSQRLSGEDQAQTQISPPPRKIRGEDALLHQRPGEARQGRHSPPGAEGRPYAATIEVDDRQVAVRLGPDEQVAHLQVAVIEARILHATQGPANRFRETLGLRRASLQGVQQVHGPVQELGADLQFPQTPEGTSTPRDDHAGSAATAPRQLFRDPRLPQRPLGIAIAMPEQPAQHAAALVPLRDHDAPRRPHEMDRAAAPQAVRLDLPPRADRSAVQQRAHGQSGLPVTPHQHPIRTALVQQVGRFETRRQGGPKHAAEDLTCERWQGPRTETLC